MARYKFYIVLYCIVLSLGTSSVGLAIWPGWYRGQSINQSIKTLIQVDKPQRHRVNGCISKMK